jgi:hypothetical protein
VQLPELAARPRQKRQAVCGLLTVALRESWMVARYRVWIALGLGLLSASLAPGCRSYSRQGHPGASGSRGGGEGGTLPTAGSAGNAGMMTTVSGSGGDVGATIGGDAGAEGETGGTSGASSGGVSGTGGASAGGGNPPLGGTGSEPEFSGRDVDVVPNKAPEVDTQWTRVVPFADQGTPHFVTYHDQTGNVSFRRYLDLYQGSTELVWSGQWEDQITAFSRLRPMDMERLVLYWADTGIRRVVTFKADLQGEQVLLETNVGKGFTLHTNEIAPTSLPYLYWYKEGNQPDGNLLVDILDAKGEASASSFTGKLPENYQAIGAVGDRLLGFHAPNFDVFDLVELGATEEPSPVYATGLSGVERVVAFELDGIPMLFVYNLATYAKVIELAWMGDRVRFQELWTSGVGPFESVIGDAASVTGLSLPGEQLIFLHGGTDQQRRLQPISITLKPVE